MSEQDSNFEMAPPPQPVRRLGLGLRSVLQIIFAVLCVGFVFYLGITHHSRKDLTQTGAFTLSEATIKLLDSSSLQDREKPVKIIAALRKGSPHHPRLRALIEEYERLADGKIKVDYLDPILDKDRAAEVANNYSEVLADQLFSDEIFIIDARQSTPEEKPDQTKDEKVLEAINSGLRYLNVQDMLVMRIDENKQRRIVGYRDEDFLSSALQSALEGRPRVMYLLEDKSDIDVGDANSPWVVLRDALGKQNIILISIRISELEKIPNNAEGVVLVAPQYDFEPKEMEALKEYWRRESASLMFYLDPSARPNNLRAFMRDHGVTLQDDRVLTTRNRRTETKVQAAFTSLTNVSAKLEGKSTTFEGRVASLEVREGAEDLATRGITCISLIEADPRYWGETNYTQSQPTYDDQTDNPGPLSIGAAVIKGNANNDLTADKVSKMIILSTTDFLEPGLRNAQLDFVKNSTHWLLGREELIGIGPRGLERRRLNLIKEEVTQLQRIAVFFIPFGLFLIGMMVWNSRRA
ncbi:MAG: GldG family protein [Akkermansiaceae bacterium]|nr:GldG family protein [Akkermansiaceae bacterium]